MDFTLPLPKQANKRVVAKTHIICMKATIIKLLNMWRWSK